MAPHSSILAWRIPLTEEPGGAAVSGVAKSQTRLSDKHFHFISAALNMSKSIWYNSMYNQELVNVFRARRYTELSFLMAVGDRLN